MTCLIDIKNFDEEFFEKIKDTENKTAAPDKKSKNHKASVCGRVLLGYMLKREFDIDSFSFYYGEKDKPYLKNEDIFFNISHSGNLVLCSTDRCEIGCDVQKIADYNPRVAEKFFAENEVSLIEKSQDKNRAFIKLWTLKESILKKCGTGITGGLANYDFSDYSGSEDFTAFDCRFTCFSLEEYEIAVCSESAKQVLEIISKEEIEKYIDNINSKKT